MALYYLTAFNLIRNQVTIAIRPFHSLTRIKYGASDNKSNEARGIGIFVLFSGCLAIKESAYSSTNCHPYDSIEKESPFLIS